MEKEYEKVWMEEKKKLRGEKAKLKKTKLSSESKKGSSNTNSALNEINYGHDLAIMRLTARDISPLPPTKIKKKRKELSTTTSSTTATIHIGNGHLPNDTALDIPSVPALASMMLSDPFVVRLFLEKIFRTIRVQVRKDKSVFLPSCHATIPSLFQILHIVQGSTQLCAIKGKKYSVPDSGLSLSSSNNSNTITINIKQEKEDKSSQRSTVFYLTLRIYAPRYAGFLLSLYMDERLSLTGDLYPVLSSSSSSSSSILQLNPIPSTSPNQWLKTTSMFVIRSLVQYALVFIFAGTNNSSGRNNEKLALSLQTQLPRFKIVLSGLSGGNMLWERPFWRSLAGGLLGWKRKLGINVRDLIVDFWMDWFQSDDNSDSKDGCLCAPVHEIFIYLLNEWASLGNLILPRDKLLSLSTLAVEKAEATFHDSATSTTTRPFALAWFQESSEFIPIKRQYESMLKIVGVVHADLWKEKMGIDGASYERYIKILED